jgi:D-alanyl-D-alanine carboxypeptidase (penicillin-binding protein 5/6)
MDFRASTSEKLHSKRARASLYWQGSETSMHKTLVLALSLILFVGVFSGISVQTTRALAAESNTEVASEPVLNTQNAILETEDGTVLFQTSSGSPVNMASTTKIMTAVLALESGISLDTTYTFSELAASNESTTAGYQAGEVVTLRDMLQVLLIYSAGDAADGIAELVGGSIDNFVAMMNERASELGMTDTLYTSPSGYIDDDYTTPSDLLIIFRHAMSIDQFRSIVGMKQVTLTVAGEQKTFENTDWLLESYPGMLGGKTGYTYGANWCFVGAAQRGGVTLYFCVLGEESTDNRAADCTSLLDWGFSQYPETTLCVADTNIPILGYMITGYRFGRISLTTASASLSTRLSSDTLSEELVAYELPYSFSLPGDTVGCVSWSDDERLRSSRHIEVSTRSILAESFGPFNTALFF